MAKILHLKSTPTRIDVHAAISRWLSLKPANTKSQYLRRAKTWSMYLGCSLDDERAGARWIAAKHSDALDYANQLADRKAQDERHGKISSNTIRQHCVVLKSIYDELIAQGLTESNPFMRVVKELKEQDAGERRPHRRIPTEKVRQLLSFIPRTRDERQDMAILSLFFGAALRRSEVINIRIGDVRKTEKGTTVIHLLQTKSQKAQSVSLPSWAAKNVNEWLAIRQRDRAASKDYLIVRYDTKGDAHPLSDSAIYRWWKAMCHKHEIGDDWTPHCARVTAITQLLDQGKDHRAVQELSRHSSVQMVERYDKKRIEADESASKDLDY
jgi:integrase